MIRSVMLAARFPGVPPLLAFTIDDETLALDGAGAEDVRRMMRAAADGGSVVIDPYPTTVEIRDPLRDRGEFAAVLAVAYQLPDWLRDWLPPEEPDDFEDDGTPIGIPTY